MFSDLRHKHGKSNIQIKQLNAMANHCEITLNAACNFNHDVNALQKCRSKSNACFQGDLCLQDFFLATCQDVGQTQHHYTGMDSFPQQGKQKTMSDGRIDKLMRHKTLPRRPIHHLPHNHLLKSLIYTLFTLQCLHCRNSQGN